MSKLASEELACVQKDAHGVMRVGRTRVPFSAVVGQFNEGHSPDAILREYPALSLADVYAAISYYLRYRESLDQVLAQEELMLEQLAAPVRAASAAESASFLRRLKARSQR